MIRTRRFVVKAAAGLGLGGALWALPAVPLLAQESQPKRVSMKGTLACLGCDLKKAHGAKAQCSVYGHKHALKTADGKYYTFLENEKSEPLIKGEKWHGKPVEVTGLLFPGTQVLEVVEFKAPEAR